MSQNYNLIGKQLGNYKILDRLGAGGMSTIFRAEQIGLNREVAVKVLPYNLAQKSSFIARFEREAQVIGKLDEHPNIVSIIDYGTEDNINYVVMPLLAGGSLGDQLRNGKEYSLSKIADLLDSLASALDFAHEKGVIHRDIKPDNILFDKFGTPFISDFGVAKLIAQDATDITGGTADIGTPKYMAPEQWRGGKVVDASDQYSLAVVIYFMVTKQFPFESDTPQGLMYKHLEEKPISPDVLRDDLQPGVSKVIIRALSKNPRDRYSTVQDFAKAFRNSTETNFSRIRSRNHYKFGVIILVASLLITTLLSFIFMINENGDENTPIVVSLAPTTETELILPLTETVEVTEVAIQVIPSVSINETSISTIAATATNSASPTIIRLLETTTPSATYTNTLTPIPTITSTIVITASQTNQSATLNTPSTQNVLLLTQSPTPTATASPTFTPTASPTFTPTASPTFTPTASPTFTPTITPTLSPAALAQIGIGSNDDWSPYSQQDTFGVDMVLVPIGNFIMGSTSEEIEEFQKQCNESRQDGQDCSDNFFENEESTETIYITKPFWLDQNEVTREMYQECVDNGQCIPGLDSDYSTNPQQPINRVTWFQANLYCSWRDARLPTEAEWEYAARGPDRLTFPWGNDLDSVPANHCDQSCIDTEWASTFIYTIEQNNDGFDVTSPVGSFENGISWVGAFDMAGNVWEWTNSIYTEYPYVSSDIREDTTNTIDIKRVLRGGSFDSPQHFLRSAVRDGQEPNIEFVNIGFRCARDLDETDSAEESSEESINSMNITEIFENLYSPTICAYVYQQGENNAINIYRYTTSLNLNVRSSTTTDEENVVGFLSQGVLYYLLDTISSEDSRDGFAWSTIVVCDGNNSFEGFVREDVLPILD